MTKYVLNSGGIRNNPESTKKFFAEIVKGLDKNPKVLVCCFAELREDWERKYKQYLEFYPEGVNPVFELALPEHFAEQVKNTDVIYIRGGDDQLLMHRLGGFDLPKLWDRKVVATSSAGSNVLVKHFWTCDWRKCLDGFDILPIKFLSHYKSLYGADDPRGPVDWDKGYNELENYGDKTLPIHALKEGEFVVLER